MLHLWNFFVKVYAKFQLIELYLDQFCLLSFNLCFWMQVEQHCHSSRSACLTPPNSVGSRSDAWGAVLPYWYWYVIDLYIFGLLDVCFTISWTCVHSINFSNTSNHKIVEVFLIWTFSSFPLKLGSQFTDFGEFFMQTRFWPLIVFVGRHKNIHFVIFDVFRGLSEALEAS